MPMPIEERPRKKTLLPIGSTSLFPFTLSLGRAACACGISKACHEISNAARIRAHQGIVTDVRVTVGWRLISVLALGTSLVANERLRQKCGIRSAQSHAFEPTGTTYAIYRS